MNPTKAKKLRLKKQAEIFEKLIGSNIIIDVLINGEFEKVQGILTDVSVKHKEISIFDEEEMIFTLIGQDNCVLTDAKHIQNVLKPSRMIMSVKF